MPPKRKYDGAGTAETVAVEADEWAQAEDLAAELAGEALPADGPPREAIEVPPDGTEAELEGDGSGEVLPPIQPASAPSPGFSTAEARREILRELGARRAELASQVSALELELYAAIRGARAAGVPKQVIAKDAGVARQTVYNVLGKGV